MNIIERKHAFFEQHSPFVSFKEDTVLLRLHACKTTDVYVANDVLECLWKDLQPTEYCT